MSKKITLTLTKCEAEQLWDAAGQMRDDQAEWNRSTAPSPQAATAWTDAYNRAMDKLSRALRTAAQ